MTENKRFWLIFAKSGSINSDKGEGVRVGGGWWQLVTQQVDAQLNLNNIGRNFLLGKRKKIAKSSMRTFTLLLPSSMYETLKKGYLMAALDCKWSGNIKLYCCWPRRDLNTQLSDLKSDMPPLCHGVLVSKLCVHGWYIKLPMYLLFIWALYLVVLRGDYP